MFRVVVIDEPVQVQTRIPCGNDKQKGKCRFPAGMTNKVQGMTNESADDEA
jgi:hypothetical protein